MNEKQRADQQTGQSESIAHFLDDWTSRAKSRGGNVGAAEVVDHNSDRKVVYGDDALAEEERSVEVTGLSHLGGDGEEGGGTGVSEHDGADGGNGAGEVWVTDDLVVWNPDSVLGSGCWSVLETDGDSDDQDYDG